MAAADHLSVGGVVQGALQPIANAEVHVYAVDPQNSSALQNVELTPAVRSDSHGAFQFPATVVCPAPASLIYVKAMGGVPAATGLANRSIALLNVLGTCSSLLAETTATINELSTVGAAWPLAAFESGSGQFLPAAGQAAQFSAAVGLIGKLVNSDLGTTPGRLLTADEVAPVAAMNSLANAIAACIVTNGGSAGDSSACGQLFSLAGDTSGRPPTDTLAAALLIARNPARDVAELYTLATTKAIFQPSLTSAPADWVLATRSAGTLPAVTAGGAEPPTAPADNLGAAAVATGNDSAKPVVAHAQTTPLVANTIVITAGGTYQGDWVSTDPTVAAVTIKTDQPVTIQNSTVTGPGNMIQVTGSTGANLTLLNVTGTGLDPMVAGRARGAFLVAYIMNSLSVQNCTMIGTQFGIKLAFSNSASIKILNNKAINLEDRASDGNGGFQTTRPQPGKFVLFYQVVAPNGAEIGWNQMVQTMGQSSVDNAIEIYKSQGTYASPILVHDNYVEGMSSPAVTNYYGNGLAATGDNTTLETTFVNFLSNEVVHAAGSGITISNGHDNTAQGNRVVSCGQNSAGVWYTKSGANATVLWNYSKAPTFYNNTITTTAGGLIIPNATGKPAVADSIANPVDLQTVSNSVSGNLFTDPCLVAGVLTISAEDTERAFWANKLSTNSETIGDQHGPITVSVNPANGAVAQGRTQQFTATTIWASNTNVTWAISPAVGAISSTGLYTAPSSVTSPQTITVTATSLQNNTTTGSATFTLNPPVSISITPAMGTLFASATQQFTATIGNTTNTSVTWSMSPSFGTLSAAGLYTAPSSVATQQTVTITATSAADTTRTAIAVMTVGPPVSVAVTPASLTISAAQTQQFTATLTNAANTAVTWSMSPASGTLSATGLYTAPASIATRSTVTITATSVQDTTRTATAVVTMSPSVGVSVSPSLAALVLSQVQQLTATVTNAANASVTWSVSPAVGSISSSGVYTAPAALASLTAVTVTATSVTDPTKSASATLTINPTPIVISPSPVSLSATQTQQFSAQVQGTANQSVSWSMSPSVGTLSTNGLYTAPSTVTTVQNVGITAYSSAIGKYTIATVTLLPPVRVNFSSASYFVDTVNQTSQFVTLVSYTPNTAVTWSISPAAGSISATGLYTAPGTITTQQTITVTATTVADPTKSVTGTVLLNPPVYVLLSPSKVTLLPSATQQFTASVAWSSNTAVTWSMNPSLGTLSSAGLYTAPSNTTAVQTVVVTATSVADPTKSATAALTLNPPVSVSLTPATASVTLNQTQGYTATVLNTSNTSVTWSISPAVGSISSGRYSPPATAVTSPQTVTVTATSVVDTTKSANAVVTVNPPVAVSVSPSNTSLYASQTQQFTPTVLWNTNTAVTYSISPSVGTISSTGLYTAPASITSTQTITVAAASVADGSKYALASITLQQPVKVNFSSASYFADTVNQASQFVALVTNTSNTAVTWTISPAVGSISATGLYTAPANITAQQTITVTATTVADPAKSVAGTVLLNPPVYVILSPGAVTLTTAHTLQFTASVAWSSNTAVIWSMSSSAGTLSTSGLYTAPATITTNSALTVTATSVADPTKSATSTINLLTLLGPAPITITEGGTYAGNWVSTDPTIPTVTINTDAPVIIENSTMQGPGQLILVNGIQGANVTVRNSTGTGVDSLIAGQQRGSFITAYMVQSLTVQNNTMSGLSYGVKVGTSPALTFLSILNNVASQLEDRASDGTGGLTTSRPQLGHFVGLYNVVAPNGGEIGWNQVVQTIGRSSMEDAINIYNSQGASGFPLLVHDNYLEGYSSSTADYYTGNGLITDGDSSGVTSYVVFQANEMVHAAGGGVALASGHDNSAIANRVVSCGKDSSGNWYAQTGASAAVIWNYYGSTNFENNTITTTAGGMIAPNSSGVLTISDGGIIGTVGNSSNSGNQFTDPCLVNGSLNLAAEDTERAFWANKLSTNNIVLGDQH